MAQGPGARSTVVSSRATPIVHQTIVFEQNIVGTAFKVAQVDRWTRPVDANKIAQGEEFEIEVGGHQYAPLTDGLSSAVDGDLVYINPSTNALTKTKATGVVPVGVIDAIILKGGVQTAQINTNALHAFLAAA